MNKQKQKDLCNFQLDHAPKCKKPSKWRNFALMVVLLAAIIGLLFLTTWVVVEIECNVNWRKLCG